MNSQEHEREAFEAWALPRIAKITPPWEAAESAWMARAAQAAEATLYVECRECAECGEVTINDDNDLAACNTCDWSGPSPVEDLCPSCNRVGTMTTACSDCGARTRLLASAHLAHLPAAAEAGEEIQHLKSLLIGWLDHGHSRARDEETRIALGRFEASELDLSTHMAKRILAALKGDSQGDTK